MFWLLSIYWMWEARPRGEFINHELHEFEEQKQLNADYAD